MSDWSAVAAGVKVVLEAANGKLTVYTEPPPHPLKYPCVVLEPTLEGVDYDLDMGDNAWSFVMPLTLTVRSGQANEGWRELMKYLSPTGTESIKAGIRTDTTLNAAVDDSIIEGVRNIGRDPQSEDAVQLFGATFLLRVYESIT